jgi:hypothetical protein
MWLLLATAIGWLAAGAVTPLEHTQAGTLLLLVVVLSGIMTWYSKESLLVGE